MSSAKVLVVDDEANLARLVHEWLGEEGYEVYSTTDGSQALRLFHEHRPALSIIDLLMPGMDGFELIRRIREVSQAHILVLTAVGTDESITLALDLGADEYLVKPVTGKAFGARVHAILRRAAPPEKPLAGYSDALLSLSYSAREAKLRGEPLDLKPTAFRLLAFLCQNSDRVVPHQQLIEGVWSYGKGSRDSLKWYICALRQKIEDNPGKPRILVTVHSVGYRYLPPQPLAEPDPETAR